MPTPLAALEAQRDGILREIAQLGDMRKGSITEAFRPVGSPAAPATGATIPVTAPTTPTR